jgi:hypothetical protein
LQRVIKTKEVIPMKVKTHVKAGGIVMTGAD